MFGKAALSKVMKPVADALFPKERPLHWTSKVMRLANAELALHNDRTPANKKRFDFNIFVMIDSL
jgi:hypothetical protein